MLLEDWEIASHKLKLLDKKLGEGRFSIVKVGLLTSEQEKPEAVAVKTLKGAKKTKISLECLYMIIQFTLNKTKHSELCYI